MAFQFLCPQGHLLQGDESQAGQQCMCPYCNSLFLVPQPLAPPPEPQPSPPSGLFGDAGAPASGYGPGGYQTGVFESPAPEPEPGPGVEAFPGIRTAPDFRGGGLPAGESPPISVSALPGSAATAPVVHVLCPSGHELETPRDMLGQDAMCPYCQIAFRLRFEDSIEYRKEKAEELEMRERRAAKAWMQWSIAAAAVVVVGVIVLIAIAASH
jgi:glutaredoxin